MGHMRVDWAALTITFKLGEKKVIIKGDPSLTRVEISLKMLTKSWNESDQGFLVELKDLNLNEQRDEEDSGEEVSVESLPIGVKHILSEYKNVLEPLVGLHPKRAVDNQIVMKESHSPVNLRPYKYVHAQKLEIERLMSEMLATSIIRPSNSLFF